MLATSESGADHDRHPRGVAGEVQGGLAAELPAPTTQRGSPARPRATLRSLAIEDAGADELFELRYLNPP